MQEIISGLLMVKVFGAEDKVDERVQELQTENYKIKVRRNLISIIANTSFSFIFSAGYLYGLLWGAVNIVAGAVTYGTLTAILSLISQIQSPVAEISSFLPQYYGALASAERLMELEKYRTSRISTKTTSIPPRCMKISSLLNLIIYLLNTTAMLS